MIVCAIDGRFPQKRRVEKFIDDVINHFFPNDIKKNVLIITNIKTDLGDDAGLCCNAGMVQLDSPVMKSAQVISVELSRNMVDYEDEEHYPYTIKEIVATLAHELVHAKQYIRGELTEKQYRWAEMKNIKHKDLPWEIEAYGMEDELVDLYW
jgi:hypothetical protein